MSEKESKAMELMREALANAPEEKADRVLAFAEGMAAAMRMVNDNTQTKGA